MQDTHVKLNPGLAWQKQHSTEERYFHQQSGLIFKQETRKVLYLEQNFVWFWNVDISESRSEIPGKFWSVVLEKDGEDQSDRSCEKWRSRVKGERSTISGRKANLTGHMLCRNSRLKRVIERKIEGRIEVTRRRGRRHKQLTGCPEGNRRVMEI